MGGRAAEEIVFGHFTTGASDDIKKATDIARKMVCQWGMSDKLGPVHLGREHNDPFLGREMGRTGGQSEQTSQVIDQEVNRIISSAYDRAKAILTENRKTLERLAEALLIKETVEGKDLDRLLNGEDIVSEEEVTKYRERSEATKKAAPAASTASVFAPLPLPKGHDLLCCRAVFFLS